ncbi:unnamed protein product [Ceutorhynchus assimilis]|uniref:Uncharacterized protein n=1 Tax=Ceutorhynchus assimilis TaxID=467358 RepID=A0A9N9MS64_9CUCU|nr:unnamed protein product [Ceutorhynchus assimilis]
MTGSTAAVCDDLDLDPTQWLAGGGIDTLHHQHHPSLSTSNAPEVVDPLQTDLDQRVLSAMGANRKKQTLVGEPLHDILANHCGLLLKTGLSEDQLNETLAKYPTPENCPFVVPVKLNAKIRAALNEAGRKRDERLIARQKEVGIALTAEARAQSILLNRPDKDEETLKALAEAPLDTYLFEEDLGERIKTAKSISKSVADLRADSSKPKYAPQTLKAQNPNSLGPLRQKKYKPQRRSGQNRYYQESRFPKEEERGERERGRKFPPRKFNK